MSGTAFPNSKLTLPNGEIASAWRFFFQNVYQATGGGNSSIAAANVSFTPAGTVTVANVQLAIAQLDSLKVPTTRAVNGHALTTNVTLTASDVGAPSGSGTSTGTNTGDQFTSQTASTLIGRGSAGVGVAQTIALGAGLAMSGTTLNATTTGRLIGIQTITATGTYTPTAGTSSVIVELAGGGGAGGGAAATGVGQFSAAAGGSAGGYARSYLTSGFAGVTVTVGAGGAGSAGAAGANGTATSFGAVFQATGGAGAAAGAVTTAGTVTASGPGAAGTGSGGNVLNSLGGPGGLALYVTPTGISGGGGASMFGNGGTAVSGTAAGVSAASKGAGGSGGSNLASQAANAGGNGAPGLCIVYEFA